MQETFDQKKLIQSKIKAVDVNLKKNETRIEKWVLSQVSLSGWEYLTSRDWVKHVRDRPAPNISLMIITVLFVHCYEYTNGVTG